MPEESVMIDTLSALDRATIEVKSVPQALAMVANLKHLDRCTHVDTLRGRYAGGTAYVVAAGPSLPLADRTLSRAQSDAIIIAVNTALPALERLGIRPHLVCVMESIDLSSQLPTLHDHRLLLDCSVAPQVMEAARDPIVFHGPSAEQRLYHHALRLDYVDHSGAALTAAVSCAYRMGCAHVMLCGADLGGREGRFYAPGSMWDLEMTRSGETLVFAGAEERDAVHVASGQAPVPRSRPAIEVPACDGGATYTTADYLAQAEWLAERARHHSIWRLEGDGSVAIDHVRPYAWQSLPTIPWRNERDPIGRGYRDHIIDVARRSLEAAIENAEAVLAGRPLPHLELSHSVYEALVLPTQLRLHEDATLTPRQRTRALWEHTRDCAAAAIELL